MAEVYPLPEPWPWDYTNEFREVAKATYIRCIEEMNISDEPGLRDILINVHGFSMEDISSLQQLGSMVWPIDYVMPVFKIMNSLQYKRPEYNKFTPARGETSEPEQIWTSVKPGPIKASEILEHPEGFDCVFVAKSMIIHYAIPGKKKALCGKAIASVPTNVNDPMYSICPKCKSLT